VHHHFFRNLHLGHLQFDELYTTLRDKVHDVWIWVAFDAKTKLIPAVQLEDLGVPACRRGEVGLWDLKTRESIRLASADQLAGVYAVAFSPDSRLLASGDANGSVYVWDLVTRQRVGPLLCCRREVDSLAFSPDGKLLAAGGQDEIVLWSVTTFRRLGDPLRDQPGHIYSLAFSPDGTWLISGGSQGTVYAWIIGKEALQTKLCEVVGRNMTRPEWDRYLPTTPYRTTCPQWPEPSPTPVPSTPLPSPTPTAGPSPTPDMQVFAWVRNMLVELLGVDESKVTLDARIREDLQADDLDKIELVMAVEEKFGREISDEEAGSLQTVRDIVYFISRQSAP